MKTFFVAAALALTSLSSFANKTAAFNRVNISVSRAFQDQFGENSSVRWSEASNKMLRATFEKDGETISAFFSESGELLGSTINRSAAELPLKVKASLAEKVKEGNIAEAVEYTDSDEHAYFVKIASEKGSKYFKVTEGGLIKEVKFE